MTAMSLQTGDTVFALAYRAHANGRTESAVAIALATHNARPDAFTTWKCINFLLTAGRIEKAKELARSSAFAQVARAERYIVHHAMASIALAEGRVADAVDLLQADLTANPMHRGNHYLLVSLLPHLGRFDEANRLAMRGTLVVCGDHLPTSIRTVRFPDPADGEPSTSIFARTVTYETNDVIGSAPAIYFIGCDSRYFLLFGEALANSLTRRAVMTFALHVHLVNPSAEAEALLQRLRTAGSVPITCSREQADFSALSERHRRSYLSCARYLMLPELLARYGRTMLVADTDQLVVGNLTTLMQDAARHDVGVMRNDAQLPNIFSLISASVLTVSPTDGGRRFAKTLHDTIALRLADPAALGWHLDQTSLAIAHLWHRDIDTLHLPMWIMDSVIDRAAAADTLAPEALFWSITMTHIHTARKLDTELFRQFLAPEPVPTGQDGRCERTMTL